MRKKQAANYAFVNDVESPCIVETTEIWVSLSYTREKDEFSLQISHCIQLYTFALKRFLAADSPKSLFHIRFHILKGDEEKIIVQSFCWLKEEQQLKLHFGRACFGVLSCLGFVAFAGSVWKSHRTSQKVVKRHRKSTEYVDERTTSVSLNEFYFKFAEEKSTETKSCTPLIQIHRQ